jgi:hypothetical protein
LHRTLGVEHPYRDLADRWRCARRSALAKAVPEAPADDEELLAAGLRANPEEVERRVFANGLALGESFARFRGRPLALAELPEALAGMDVPCLQGSYRSLEDGRAVSLSREGCPHAAAERCDYWREATFGLVYGATGGARLARHQSLGHGGPRCVDVFHEDPESPLRFEAIPVSLEPSLARASRLARAFDGSAEVRFLGLSEGVLVYRIERRGCAGSFDVRPVVERAVQRDHPDLTLFELSPRPVMEEGR